MKKPVIAIPSFVITTIVYALLYPIFFELDNIYGEGVNFVVYDDDKTMMTYSQQSQVVEIEKECKSPCPESSEMCIQMCA